MDLPGILNAAVEEGFLTATAAKEGITHSEGFLCPVEDRPLLEPGGADLAIDLGTGGGLPGLVLAARTSARWVLIERSERRFGFLVWATTELGLGARVEVVNADAGLLAHSAYRGQALLVTARSFASPAVTAEIGSAFLAVGSTLVISEPPSSGGTELRNRWPVSGIARLGLVDAGSWHTGRFGYQGLCCRTISRDGVPRSLNAITAKPMF
ncbi:MAG: RsmG family class I SAM-dependent methyltransferase [Actinomycetota bacterium]|nr:RsmG family class I SAM-dependent methyltransferase [Actinomycetota bacterium]